MGSLGSLSWRQLWVLNTNFENLNNLNELVITSRFNLPQKQGSEKLLEQ